MAEVRHITGNCADNGEPTVAESHQEEEQVADVHRLMLRLSGLPADSEIEVPGDEDSDERRDEQRNKVRQLICVPFCLRDDAVLSVELKTVVDEQGKQVWWVGGGGAACGTHT